MGWCGYLLLVIVHGAACFADGSCSLDDTGCMPDKHVEEDNVQLLQMSSMAKAFRTMLEARAKAETTYGTVIELDLRTVYTEFHKAKVNPSHNPDPKNPGLSFDQFIELTGLGRELTPFETKLFRERFIDMVFFEEQRDGLNEIKNPERLRALLLEEEAIAFELEKPAVTQKQIEIINADPQIGWNATITPDMQNLSKDMFHHMLGAGDADADPVATDKDPDFSGVRIVPLMDANSTTEVKSMQEVQLDEDLQVELPTNFDSRRKWSQCKDVIGRALSQGTCGSCWAFSASAVTDSRLCIVSGGKFQGQVSRGFITSCEGQHSSQNGNGCKGGLPRRAFKLIEDTGVPTGGSQGCVPYFGTGNSLKHFTAHDAAPACPAKCGSGYGASLADDVYHLKGYGKYKQFVKHHYKNQDVKNELYKNGPISALIYASNALSAYKCGVYDGGGCDGNYPKTTINHAVTAIGWGPSYMIMLNSWGRSWGNEGTFNIAYCGVASYEAPGSFSSHGRPAGWDSTKKYSRRRWSLSRRRTAPGRGDASQRRRRSVATLKDCDMKHGGTVHYSTRSLCRRGCPKKLGGHVVNCCYVGLCAAQEPKWPQVGDKVEGKYRNGRFYGATISSIRGDTYILDWDDGDQQDREKKLQQLRKPRRYSPTQSLRRRSSSAPSRRRRWR